MPQIILDSQADWQRGAAQNLDLVSSPGDVKLPHLGVAFDGVSGYVSIPDGPTLDTSGSMTVEARFNPLGLPALNSGLVSKTGNYILWFPASDGRIRFADTYGHYFETSATAWDSNDHWATGVYDGATGDIRIYIDAALAAGTKVGAWAGGPSTYGLTLGRNTAYFNGVISEVRIWNVVRTQAEIQAALNADLSGAEPGLLGLWKFRESSGLTALDSTANHNDGALVGGVTRVYSPTGTLTLLLDTGAALAAWQALALEGLQLPGISYRSRSSFDQLTWSPWADGLGCPRGRFVQLEITLTTADSAQTPVLSRAVLDYLAATLERWSVRVGQPRYSARVGAPAWNAEVGRPAYEARAGEPAWQARVGKPNWLAKVGRP